MARQTGGLATLYMVYCTGLSFAELKNYSLSEADPKSLFCLHRQAAIQVPFISRMGEDLSSLLRITIQAMSVCNLAKVKPLKNQASY